MSVPRGIALRALAGSVRGTHRPGGDDRRPSSRENFDPLHTYAVTRFKPRRENRTGRTPAIAKMSSSRPFTGEPSIVMPGDRITDASGVTKAGTVQVFHPIIPFVPRFFALFLFSPISSTHRAVSRADQNFVADRQPQLGTGLTMGKDDEVIAVQSGVFHTMT